MDRVDALAAKLCETVGLCKLDLIRYLCGRHYVNTMLGLASIRRNASLNASLCAGVSGYVAATEWTRIGFADSRWIHLRPSTVD